MNLLYIGDDLVDLGNATISITIKAIEVGKLQVRSVSYTNSFTAPRTENNDRIFGYTSNEKSRSSKAYQLLSFKLVHGGIETFRGKAIVKNFNKGYKIQLLEEIYDVFANIKDKPFRDLGTFPNSAWRASDIDNYRTATSGMVSVVIDWGKNSFQENIYNSGFFLPSFYYHSVITSILQSTGLSLSGSILTDARFKDLVIPFPGDSFEITSGIDANLFDSDTVSEGQNILNPLLAGELIEWTDSGYITSNKYTVPDLSPSPFTMVVRVTLNLSDIAFNAASYFRIQLIHYDGTTENTIAQSAQITSANGSFVTISFTNLIPSLGGDQIYLKLYPDVGPSPASLELIVDNTSTFQIEGSNRSDTTDVNWNLLWPEISCTDLLKDFLIRFNIIMKEDKGTIYLKSLEDIIADRANAIDWSAKLVKSDTNIDFTLSLAQINYFRYNDQVNNEFLGTGQIDINNTTLVPEKDEFTSPFENCIQLENDSFKCAQISVYDFYSADVLDFKNSPGFKLLTLKARTTEPAIIFSTAARTDYKLGYFVDVTQSKDTGFQYFIDQFYAKYAEALQFNKVVLKQFYLTENDIQNYDPHKIIWDGEGYYLVNKISNFIPNQITNVELFKVG